MAVNPYIFLVDDHPMVREGLSHLLQGAGFTIAGEAADAGETLAHAGLRHHPLFVVDLALGEENGTDLIQHLHRRGFAVLVFSMHEGASAIRRALEAGANGYVTKREAAHSLVEAVRTILAGGRYLSARAKAAMRAPAPLDDLSSRQMQIFELLGRGCANDEIARELDISVRTLESYCVRIMDKLGVQGVKDLRQLAIRTASGRS